MRRPSFCGRQSFSMSEKRHPISKACSLAGATRKEFDLAVEAGAVPEAALITTSGGHRKVADLEACVEGLKAWLFSMRVGLEESGYDLMFEKARREHFAANREELRYREEAGDLIKREFHDRVIVEFGALVRARLEQLPAQNAARLSALASARDVEADLEELVRGLLAEFAAEADRITA